MKLDQRLHDEFSKRVAVQIAVGVQKIVFGLKAFNGYAALALIAYNAGLDNAYRIATSGLPGKAKQGPQFPAGTTEADWEKACHFGASLLHQPASAVKIKKGSWLCDAHNSTWKAKADFPVWDPTGKVHLIAYQYLRSIPGCIHSVATERGVQRQDETSSAARNRQGDLLKHPPRCARQALRPDPAAEARSAR